MKFYTSVFHDAGIDHVMRYEEGESSDQPGTIKHARFGLEGQEFAVMDSAYDHNFRWTNRLGIFTLMSEGFILYHTLLWHK